MHLLAMPVADLLSIAPHATPKFLHISVEPFPCCLSAYADSAANCLPRCASGNGLSDELGLPR